MCAPSVASGKPSANRRKSAAVIAAAPRAPIRRVSCILAYPHQAAVARPLQTSTGIDTSETRRAEVTRSLIAGCKLTLAQRRIPQVCGYAMYGFAERKFMGWRKWLFLGRA